MPQYQTRDGKAFNVRLLSDSSTYVDSSGRPLPCIWEVEHEYAKQPYMYRTMADGRISPNCESPWDVIEVPSPGRLVASNGH